MKLNKHQMDALALLAPEGAYLRREFVVSGFPYRVNGTGCEVRSDTIRQLTRRGLVSYHVFFNGGEWRDEYRITEAGRRAWGDALMS